MSQPISRRDTLKQIGLGAAAIVAGSVLVGTASSAGAAEASAPALTYPFTLPKLPYALDALEPHIDARTMEIHYTKHHQAYVDNLNKALKDHPDLHGKSLTELLTNLDGVPEAIRMAVRNNGGGHYNHSLFWTWMAPKAGGEPHGALADALTKKFGSFADFQKQFAEAGMKRFGSGWAWLVHDSKGDLAITSSANQDTPISEVPPTTPLLGVDVWEHAYYLKYQNRRADYLAAWWNVVNWNTVSAAFA